MQFSEYKINEKMPEADNYLIRNIEKGHNYP